MNPKTLKKIRDQFDRLAKASGEAIRCAACNRMVTPELEAESEHPIWKYACECGAWMSSIPAKVMLA